MNPFLTNCPEIVDLKLSLLLIENNISGSAELLEFGNIGDPINLTGLIQNSNFNLEPFNVFVSTDPINGFAGGLGLEFAVFEGTFLEDEVDMSRLELEGNVSGFISFGETDAIVCSTEFTGEFTGISRSPEGCVSPVEAPTLECPAEGFVNQCDAYEFYFCPGWCEPLDEGGICVDFAFNASECEVLDCLSVSCPGIGLVNLEGLDDFGSFQVIIETHTVSCN